MHQEVKTEAGGWCLEGLQGLGQLRPQRSAWSNANSPAEKPRMLSRLRVISSLLQALLGSFRPHPLEALQTPLPWHLPDLPSPTPSSSWQLPRGARTLWPSLHPLPGPCRAPRPFSPSMTQFLGLDAHHTLFFKVFLYCILKPQNKKEINPCIFRNPSESLRTQ